MATNTTNLNLSKPDLNDNIDQTIPALADNFQKIDDKITDVNAKLADLMSQSYDVKYLGITPDGVTDWRANGKLDAALKYSRDNKVPIYFPAGFYNCAMDNYYSDVVCVFADGAIFAGTIHAAINDVPGTPSSNRPSNVRFYGTVSSYDRVGCYNCDDVFIEKIHIVSDSTKSNLGRKPRGVHVDLDSRNINIPLIIVDDVDSDGDYALGIDGNTSYEPKNVSIGKIYIKDSGTHGVYLCGENNHIGEIIIDGYGSGSQTTALPNATSPESAELKGVWCNRTVGCWIDKIKVRQIAGTRTNAKDAVYNDDGNCIYHIIDVDGASRDGVANKAQVESPLLIATKIKVVNCLGNGLNVANGMVKASFIESKNNSLVGVNLGTNTKLYCSSIVSSGNSQEQLLAVGGSELYSDNIEVSGSNAAYHLFRLSGSNRINIQEIYASCSTKGQVGGLYLANVVEGLITKVRTVNCGINSTFCALRIEGTNNFKIVKAILKDGLGQGLRIVTVSDCTFENVIVDGHDSNISGASLTNCAFMNCKSINAATSLTNLSATSAAFFNSDTCHT